MTDMGNKPGVAAFYVEPDCCMLCGVPETIAPDLFVTGANHCALRRQPRSPAEIDKVINAMWSSEVACIRYAGSDRAILARLGEAGMANYANDPSAYETAAVCRDHVAFVWPMESDTASSAIALAATFRDDLRHDGVTIRPGRFRPRTVRLAWFERNFHEVTFVARANGNMAAVLRSRGALVGLAWRVDGWLRRRAAENIRWHTADGKAVRETPI